MDGHLSASHHRLPGGLEAHNPENLARLTLAQIVPEEDFAYYVSKPGGHILRFQGPSGLWYHTGRAEPQKYAGHYVNVYTDKHGIEQVAFLCAYLKRMPLAEICLAHYMSFRTDEMNTWTRAVVSKIQPSLIPKGLVGTLGGWDPQAHLTDYWRNYDFALPHNKPY
jgi:hypothetical protein